MLCKGVRCFLARGHRVEAGVSVGSPSQGGLMKKRFALACGFAGIIFGVAIAMAGAQSGSAGQAGRGAAPPPTSPCGPNLPADVKNVAKDSRCFELRTYTVREGSSIDLLHKRFRERTTALFKDRKSVV